MIGADDHPLVYDPEWTIPRALAGAPTLNPTPGAGYTFIRGDGSFNKLPFADLDAEVWRRGRKLLELGLRKGDRLCFVVPDGEEFVLSFLGATCVGIIPVPLYPPLGMGKLDAYLDSTARILKRSGSRMLLTGPRVAAVLWSLIDAVDTLEAIHTTDKLKGEAPAIEPEPVEPDDIAFLQYTSGSTSEPKGVVVTHRSLGANGFAIMRHGLEVRVETDKALAWLPLYHDMGLIGFVISPLTAGLESAFLPTMSFIKRPSLWMEQMAKHRATITFAPNFAYGLAVRRTRPEKLQDWDLSQVRVLGAGAEPNHPGTLNAFLDHFAPAGLPREAMMPVYGMAEATLAMAFSPIRRPMNVDHLDIMVYQDEGRALPTGDPDNAMEFVSCGYAFPDHEIVAIDEAGNELNDREIGELVFRGPSVALGYFEDPENTARCFRPDGLRTGDLGYVSDGEIFVTGRQKDLIILNGKNYDPQSIEWACAEVEHIRTGNVIAFSVPGDHTEELVIVAETRLKEGLEALAAQVRDRVKEELYLHAADVRLTGPGTLPKTTSGKLQRSKARLQYMAGTLGAEGVRTMGDKGQALTVAKHVAKSAVSRFRHGLRRTIQR